MKKILSICAIALVAVMILSLTACGQKIESGTYMLIEMTENGQKVNEEELALLKEGDAVPTLIVDGDSAVLFGKTVTVEDGRLKTVSGDIIPFTVSDGKVTLENEGKTMVFKK